MAFKKIPVEILPVSLTQYQCLVIMGVHSYCRDSGFLIANFDDRTKEICLNRTRLLFRKCLP